MKIYLQLQDHEKDVGDPIKCTVGDKATDGDLAKEVHLTLHIEPRNQQLFFNNKPLPFGLLRDVGMKTGCTVYVKHAMLNHWTAFIKHYTTATTKDDSIKYDRVAREKELEIQQKSALMAVDASITLEAAKFFLTYPDLGKGWPKKCAELTMFIDRTEEAMKHSAKYFFRTVYPEIDPESDIEFDKKTGGTRSGIVINVQRHNEDLRFFMKTYHNAGSTSTSFKLKRRPPDFVEMMAYRLFEHIGVGPRVIFSSYVKSKLIHYIITEEVRGFTMLKHMTDVNAQRKVVAESHLLALTLGVRDLNSGNIGTDYAGNFAVVDCYVGRNILCRDIVKSFKTADSVDGISSSGMAYRILSEMRAEERVNFAKDALPKWSKIRTATAELIRAEKTKLREHGIKFGTGTDEVKRYIQNVQANYESLCTGLL